MKVVGCLVCIVQWSEHWHLSQGSRIWFPATARSLCLSPHNTKYGCSTTITALVPQARDPGFDSQLINTWILCSQTYSLIPASCFSFLCLIRLNISIDHEQHLLIHDLGEGCTVTQHQNTKHLVLLISLSPHTNLLYPWKAGWHLENKDKSISIHYAVWTDTKSNTKIQLSWMWQSQSTFHEYQANWVCV